MLYIKKTIRRTLQYLSRVGLLYWIPDKIYLKIIFRLKLGKSLNLSNPKTFNEKLQWLKLHNRKHEYTKMVDKFEVRQYIAEKIGDEYLIPLLGVWDSPYDIDFDSLPNQFVLKCTHDSGGLVICRDKKTLDVKTACSKLNTALKNNGYGYGREWPYKNVKPRIVAEQYMVDESGYELKDYKFFCFNGTVKLIQVDFDRHTSHKRNIYNTSWDIQELQIRYPSDKNKNIPKPVQLEVIIELAEMLSHGIPHVRVDFYSVESHIYFGELTFYHGSGTEKFTPEEWDYTLGSWIDLSEVKK